MDDRYVVLQVHGHGTSIEAQTITLTLSSVSLEYYTIHFFAPRSYSGHVSDMRMNNSSKAYSYAFTAYAKVLRYHLVRIECQ